MHIPTPFGLIRQAQRAWCYFRTGVAVEGEAWLCDDVHSPIHVSGAPRRKGPQHVDVQLRLWNRRHERVTVMEITSANIPLYRAELTDGDWPTFDTVTLEPGAPPEERFFTLVPKQDPNGRVEASMGAWLELEFRPSRGSERWARPRVRLQLKPRASS